MRKTHKVTFNGLGVYEMTKHIDYTDWFFISGDTLLWRMLKWLKPKIQTTNGVVFIKSIGKTEINKQFTIRNV